MLSFDTTQNWSSGQGLSFRIRAVEAGIPYDVDIYTGQNESRETYLDSATAPVDAVNGWADVQIPWSEFHRADWEADAGAVFNKPNQIQEIAIGFGGLDSISNSGTIWVDDIQLITQSAVPSEPQPTAESESAAAPVANNPTIPCPSPVAIALPLALLARLKRVY